MAELFPTTSCPTLLPKEHPISNNAYFQLVIPGKSFQ